ncbi:MAG: ribosomal-protein-serine acetyltransferase [Paraglaciecola sp.]|jgi:ribosomal-protein-serine acetyltransferase
MGAARFNHFDYQPQWGAIGYWLCASFTGRGVITQLV